MTPKTLISLIVATAVLVLAGLLFYEADSAPSVTDVEGELVFDGLLGKLNDITELEVETSDGKFSVRLVDGQWGLTESAGYPVQIEKVRLTLISLAELRKVERKTDNPALYEKLGVQSVGSSGQAEAPSMSVTAKNSSGEVLAALIVGKQRAAGTGATFYVRLIGEAESWLVDGQRPPLPKQGSEWLDKKILELTRDVVRAARTTHVDGELVTIAKKDSDTDYTLLEQPPGRELKYASVAGGIAGSMQYLNFEDVTPIADFEKPDAPIAVTSLWTKDGMRLTVEVFDTGDESTWAIFHADYDLAGTPQPPAPTGPLPEGEAEAQATPRPEEVVQGEIDALNAQLEKWAYKLPQYSKVNFTKRVEDLLKPLPVEEDAAEPTAVDAGAALDALEGEIAPENVAPENAAPESVAPESVAPENAAPENAAPEETAPEAPSYEETATGSDDGI